LLGYSKSIANYNKSFSIYTFSTLLLMKCNKKMNNFKIKYFLSREYTIAFLISDTCIICQCLCSGRQKKKKDLCSSETMRFLRIVRRYDSQDNSLHSHRHDNLRNVRFVLYINRIPALINTRTLIQYTKQI
jgi:hypothetical protein